MSGPLIPAAATWISISPGAGAGVGRVTSFKTSGPPGWEISTHLIRSGTPDCMTDPIAPSYARPSTIVAKRYSDTLAEQSRTRVAGASHIAILAGLAPGTKIDPLTGYQTTHRLSW